MMSLSVARTVIPTCVPAAASSVIEFAAASVSVTGVMALSLISETAIVKVSLELDPSLEVAVTIMAMEPSVSASKLAPSATRTTPLSSTVKRVSFTEYETVSVTSLSSANAVTPTWVPATASSATVLAEVSASVTAEMSNSSTSDTAMVKVSSEVEPSEEVAVTVISMEPSVSASKLAPSATRTTPFSSIVNRASSTE